MNYSFTQAVIEARKWAHGSRNHQDAMTVLYQSYRETHSGSDPTDLTELWVWVNSTEKAREEKRAEMIAHFEKMAQTHFDSLLKASRELPKASTSYDVVNEINADLRKCLLNAWRLRHGLRSVL